jgi:tetratricopeptide (TPR) repeat protein
MLFSTTPHPALFTILFLILYSSLKVIKERKLLPLKVFSLILMIALLLGAVKLLPGLELQKEFPRLTSFQTGGEVQIRGYNDLARALLNRKQSFSDDNVLYRKLFWEEYGAYVGLIPLVLFSIGLLVNFRKYSALIITGLIFLLLSLGSYAPVNLWKILHSLPIFDNMRFPARFIIMFNFVLAIIAGVTLSRLEEMGNHLKRTGLKNWVKKGALCLVLLVLVDLIAVNGRIIKDAFVVPPMEVVEEKDNNFYHVYSPLCWGTYYTSCDGNFDMYAVFLKNKGVINVFHETPRPRNALIRESPLYKGESFLLNDKGESSIIYFSPNVVKIKVKVPENDILVLNQNYDTGWKVKGGRDNRVISTKGLASVAVTPRDHLVTFYYLPTTFILGALITSLTLVIILLYRFKKLNKRYFQYSIFLLSTIFFLYLLFGIRYFAGASPENKPLILAHKYEWAGKYGPAAKYYEKVIQTYPYYAQAHRSLGRCYLLEGKKPDEAIEVLTQAIKLQPTEWSSYHLLGTAHYNKKEYDKAIVALNEAMRLEPDEWGNYHLLGTAYYDKKEHHKAIVALNEAIRLKPGEWSNYYLLGRVYLGIKDYQKAISTCEKALALKPPAVYASMVKQDLAIARLKRLIGLNPADSGNSTRYRRLGEIYREMGEYQEVLRTYEKDLLRLNPFSHVPRKDRKDKIKDEGYPWNQNGKKIE